MAEMHPPHPGEDLRLRSGRAGRGRVDGRGRGVAARRQCRLVVAAVAAGRRRRRRRRRCRRRRLLRRGGCGRRTGGAVQRRRRGGLVLSAAPRRRSPTPTPSSSTSSSTSSSSSQFAPHLQSFPLAAAAAATAAAAAGHVGRVGRERVVGGVGTRLVLHAGRHCVGCRWAARLAAAQVTRRARVESADAAAATRAAAAIRAGVAVGVGPDRRRCRCDGRRVPVVALVQDAARAGAGRWSAAAAVFVTVAQRQRVDEVGTHSRRR